MITAGNLKKGAVVMIIDLHSDMLTHITQMRQQGAENVLKDFHLPKLKKGGISGVIMVVWIEPEYRKKPYKRTIEILGAFAAEAEENKDDIVVVEKYDDILRGEKSGKIAVILGVEGFYTADKNLTALNLLYRLGVRHIGLTWNYDSILATSYSTRYPKKGLTPLGVSAVRRMEELGMIIDVSHLSEKSFWDVYENTARPFIASHSNVFKLCPHPRNLKDEQIKAIAERGGVIGINAWHEFISNHSPCIEALIDHIDYIASLVGVDYISLGFDYIDYFKEEVIEDFCNGSKRTAGLEKAEDSNRLLEALDKRGYHQRDIFKIARGNFLRVAKAVLH